MKRPDSTLTERELRALEERIRRRATETDVSDAVRRNRRELERSAVRWRLARRLLLAYASLALAAGYLCWLLWG